MLWRKNIFYVRNLKSFSTLTRDTINLNEDVLDRKKNKKDYKEGSLKGRIDVMNSVLRDI